MFRDSSSFILTSLFSMPTSGGLLNLLPGAGFFKCVESYREAYNFTEACCTEDWVMLSLSGDLLIEFLCECTAAFDAIIFASWSCRFMIALMNVLHSLKVMLNGYCKLISTPLSCAYLKMANRYSERNFCTYRYNI